MDFVNVIEVIKGYRKGRFISVKFSRPMKTLARYRDMNLVKTTSATVRLGIDYDNMKVVAKKRTAGELPVVNSGLPWGQWRIPGYIIEHKLNMYLRAYVVPGTRPKSRYYIDGKEVSRDYAMQFCLGSESKSENDTGCITVNIENIVELG